MKKCLFLLFFCMPIHAMRKRTVAHPSNNSNVNTHKLISQFGPPALIMLSNLSPVQGRGPQHGCEARCYDKLDLQDTCELAWAMCVPVTIITYFVPRIFRACCRCYHGDERLREGYEEI